jgi:hypothetical protein
MRFIGEGNGADAGSRAPTASSSNVSDEARAERAAG